MTRPILAAVPGCLAQFALVFVHPQFWQATRASGALARCDILLSGFSAVTNDPKFDVVA